VAGGGPAGRDQPAARVQTPRPPVAPPTERPAHHHQHRRPPLEPAGAGRPSRGVPAGGTRVERVEPADRDETQPAAPGDGRRRPRSRQGCWAAWSVAGSPPGSRPTMPAPVAQG
jgi:putative serine protease PepD